MHPNISIIAFWKRSDVEGDLIQIKESLLIHIALFNLSQDKGLHMFWTLAIEYTKTTEDVVHSNKGGTLLAKLIDLLTS